MTTRSQNRQWRAESRAGAPYRLRDTPEAHEDIARYIELRKGVPTKAGIPFPLGEWSAHSRSWKVSHCGETSLRTGLVRVYNPGQPGL